MAKGSRGGQRGAGGGAVVDDTLVAEPMGTAYESFMKMSVDEKAAVIDQMINQPVPAHLSDTSFQRFIYNTQMNDKPQLVDDSVLDQMNGTELFRTVNRVHDRINDVGYNADDIIKQLQTGTTTRTSDNGGSVYGRGLYFATRLADSTSYGRTSNDIKRTAVTRAKLNSNAKIISYNKASQAAYNEMRKGTKLGRALSKADSHSVPSLYALAMGYNVIDAGNGYMNVLNRNAMTMSKTVKPMKGNTW